MTLQTNYEASSKNTDIKFFDYNLDQADIGLDGIHPNQSRIKKIVFTVQNCISSVGYQHAGCNVSVRKIPRELKIGKVTVN